MEIHTFNTKSETSVAVDILNLFHTEALPLWKEIAHEICEKFTHVFIFGVGGSSLAGQVLVQFKAPNSPKIRFIDVLDESTIVQIKRTEIATTAFIFITKSGETLETLVQTNYCLQYLNEQKREIKNHCFFLTMQGTPLWNFAKENDATTIVHPDVCGRFSCFTAVAIFPALIAGVNVESYIEGGKIQSQSEIDMAFAKSMLEMPIHITMPYIHKLDVFTEWYSQLTAESLSKGGNGYCVVRSLGTKDQHNQLQMFLDGRNDKTYTFIGNTCESGDVIHNKIAGVEIPKTRLSFLIQAGMQGVAKELEKQGKGVRIIHFDEISPKEVGKLFAFYMQEVLFQARFLQVEPFTQPSVASVKKLMFEFLQSK